MSVTIETRPTISGIAHTGYLADDLIAYWKCDENSGVTINDSVGSNTGTLNGTTTFAAPGKLGASCIYSNYFGDYVSIAGTNAFYRIWDKVSISFWIKFDILPMGSGSYNYIVFIADGLSNSTIGVHIKETDNRIYYHNIINGSINDYVYSSVITNTTSWMHVVCVTYGIGQNFKIYINGIDDTQRVWGPMANILPVYGSIHFLMNNGGTRGMFGSLDEIGIWARALTFSEVTTLYNGGTGLTYPF